MSENGPDIVALAEDVRQAKHDVDSLVRRSNDIDAEMVRLDAELDKVNAQLADARIRLESARKGLADAAEGFDPNPPSTLTDLEQHADMEAEASRMQPDVLDPPANETEDEAVTVAVIEGTPLAASIAAAHSCSPPMPDIDYTQDLPDTYFTEDPDEVATLQGYYDEHGSYHPVSFKVDAVTIPNSDTSIHTSPNGQEPNSTDNDAAVSEPYKIQEPGDA